MKTLKSILVVFAFMSFTTFSFAQGLVEKAPTNPNVIFVVSKSASCAICKANEERVMNDVLYKIVTDKKLIVINDISNKETKEESLKKLKEVEVIDLVNQKKTGIITCINLDTNKVISTISMTKSSKEIMNECQMALKG